ncbi:MAG: DMT family transporter [Marinibacterium sp.]
MTRAGQGHLAMLGFSALVAGSFALGTRIAGDIAPTALTAARFALSTLLLGAAGIAAGRIARTDLAAPWRFVVLGGLFATYFVLMFEGLKTAPAVSAAAVFTLTPILSAAFGYGLLRQVTSRRIALALAVGAAGAAWVIFRGDWAQARALQMGRGETIYFAGCMFHAIYTPMIARLNRGEHPLAFSFATMAAGCLLLLVYGWSDIRATNWLALRPLVWITLAYLVVFASAASIVLLHIASVRLPASKVMAYTYLTPSWVILWELALGGAVPPAVTLVGVALTICALILLLKDRAPDTI